MTNTLSFADIRGIDDFLTLPSLFETIPLFPALHAYNAVEHSPVSPQLAYEVAAIRSTMIVVYKHSKTHPVLVALPAQGVLLDFDDYVTIIRSREVKDRAVVFYDFCLSSNLSNVIQASIPFYRKLPSLDSLSTDTLSGGVSPDLSNDPTDTPPLASRGRVNNIVNSAVKNVAKASAKATAQHVAAQHAAIKRAEIGDALQQQADQVKLEELRASSPSSYIP